MHRQTFPTVTVCHSRDIRALSPFLTPIPHWHYQSRMTNLTYLTVSQLKSILSIMEQIEALQGQIDSIAGNGDGIPIPAPAAGEAPKKRRMSRAGRAAIAAGARARWARIKGTVPSGPKPAKKDRRSSPATRAKLAAAARARWKKAKAAGKTPL
jgi:hypothetical protein